MKIEELFPREGKNFKAAKALRAAIKKKSKVNNPADTQDSAGWAVDPHQGTFDRMRMTR